MTKTTAGYRGTSMLAALLAMATAGAADCEPGTAKQAAQAEQKIRLLEKLTSDSEPLRRLQRSDDRAALATLDNAAAIMASAKKALADGCQADAARLSNEALRLVTEAFRSSSTSPTDAHAEFRNEHERAQAFLLSLRGRSADETGLDVEAIAGIERQLRNAESMAASGSVAEARKLLEPVNDRLQRRLLELFDQRTIYYEHEFATAQDEYAYLREQYDGYMMLLLDGGKVAPYSARKRVTSLLESASGLDVQAREYEGAQQWADAIAAMNAALEYCEQATRAMGYTY